MRYLQSTTMLITCALLSFNLCALGNNHTDFNGDDIPDVLVRNTTTNGWHLYNLNNDLSIQASGGVGLTINASWDPVSLQDFNNDGYADVLVRNKDSGAWHLYYLDGNKAIKESLPLPLNNSLDWVFQDTSDFNHDGYPDILLRNKATNAWYIYDSIYRPGKLFLELIDTVGMTSGKPLLGNYYSGIVISVDGVSYHLNAASAVNGEGATYELLRDSYNTLLDQAGLPNIRAFLGNSFGGMSWDNDGLPYTYTGTQIVLASSGDEQLAMNGWIVNGGDLPGQSNIFTSSSNQGQGGGHIIKGASLPLSSNPVWQYQGTADFNKDGTNDVLVRNSDTGGWYMYHLGADNIALGTSGFINLPTDPDFTFKGIADLNADGYPDVLLRSVSTGVYSQQILTGSLTVDALDSGNLAASMSDQAWQLQSIGQYTNDQYPDLLVRNKTNGQWHVYALDGNKGVDAASGSVALTSNLVWQTVPAVKNEKKLQAIPDDFGNDGFGDVLMRKSATGGWWLYHLDGNKSPLAITGALPLTTSLDWEVKAKADFNGDGNLDVLMRNTATHGWYVYFLNGQKGLVAGSGFLPLTTDVSWQFKAVADFNGDGNNDILIRNSATHAWWVYHLNGARGVSAGGGSLPLTTDSNWEFRTAKDFNGDGNADVLVRNSNTHGWYLYHLNGSRAVMANSGFLPLTSNSDWEYLSSEDFNGDNHPDVLMRNSSTQGWYLYHLDGSKGLAPGSGNLPLTNSSQWQFRAVSDYNGDGNADVLVRNLTTGGWYVYHLNGNKGLAAGSGFLPLSSDLGWVYQ